MKKDSTLYSTSYIEASFTIIFEFFIFVSSVILLCLHYTCYTTIFYLIFFSSFALIIFHDSDEIKWTQKKEK